MLSTRTGARGALTAVAVLLGVAGCTGDTGAEADGDAVSTEASDAAATGESALDDAELGGGELPGADGASTCAADAEAATPAEAAASFPDNPGTVWTVEDVEAADGQAWVHAVPDSDAVGYPAFRFVYACAADGPELLGVYASESAGWVLLFTTDAAGADALEPSVD